MIAATKARVSPGRLLINGEWVDGSRKFDTINPATGEVLTQIVEASADDVDRTVKAARYAFDDRSGPWRKMSASERGRLLWRLADLVEKNIDELAELETLDNGKPIFESKFVDMPMVVDVLRYYAGLATKIHGETVNTFESAFTYTLREPVGVVGLIIPWNFPLLLASWKVGPALACGCTIVMKPAEQTPLTTLGFGELAIEAGVPPGVLQIVAGGPEAGKAIVRHPGIDKIAFTGSTAVGKEIMRSAADTLKRVTLELGGKSPNIVFADSDIDSAVKGAFNGIFYGKGEVCNAGSRLFIESKVRDEFTEKLVGRAKKMQPADPLDPKTRMGAIVSQHQMQTVLGYIEAGKKEGARLVAGGNRVSVDGSKGFFIEPTIFSDVTNEMKIAQEEIFGPVRSIISFDDVEQAVDQASRNPYGLAAAVWTRDIKKAHHISRQLRAGTVWINTYGLMAAAPPFGGYKHSGFGRELGADAVEQQRYLFETAPTDWDRRAITRVMIEEMRHGWQMCALLVEHFGYSGKVEAQKMLERRAFENKRLLGAFNVDVDNWMDFFTYTDFVDRDGKFQLQMLKYSAFAPLGRSMSYMLREEAFHMGTGNDGLRRIVQAGVIPAWLIQKYLNKWLSSSYDLFGTDHSSSAHWAYVWGIKGRYDEPKNEREANLDDLNDYNRHLYRDEVAGLIERFNSVLKAGEAKLYAPDIKFNRMIGRWANQKVHPQTGAQLEDKEYDQQLPEFLHSAEDKKLLLEIIANDKNWIAKKEGARHPFETIAEPRKSAINL